MNVMLNQRYLIFLGVSMENYVKPTIEKIDIPKPSNIICSSIFPNIEEKLPWDDDF